MNVSKSEQSLDRQQDLVRLAPQIISRFYPDFNRLGQQKPDAQPQQSHQPERWLCSSTELTGSVSGPGNGLSVCPEVENIPLKTLLADPVTGPRLLGAERFTKHQGSFRMLVKLLDAAVPVPLHVHPSDAYIQKNSTVFPKENLGKDEAYYFLDSPKGPCPYTHIGLHEGVDAKTLLAAMRKGSDHLLELSPVVAQSFGEGYLVKAGVLHRPGTGLTMEIQQPSDAYTIFQTDLQGKALPEELLHPGFASFEAAAEAVINWEENTHAKLIANSHLKHSEASGFPQKGGKTEWIFPPGASSKFSGMRVTVDTAITLKVNQPMLFYVWKGKGTLNNRPIDGRGGPVGNSDEFFVGVNTAKAGLEIVNSGDQPLVIFALFAQAI